MNKKALLVLVLIIFTLLSVSAGFFLGKSYPTEITPTDSPPPPPPPPPQVTSQSSSDGTRQLIMTATLNSDGTHTYTFSTTDDSHQDKQFVFTKTLDQTRTMAIPFNSWSPDNKYFFILEQTAGKDTATLVFPSSGVPFSTGEKYLDASDIFTKKGTGHRFDQATGWASNSLILINTTSDSGTKGPSYWLELPSLAVIRLSTTF